MVLVNIEYCGDCPYRFYKGNDLYCDKTDRQTTKGDSRLKIPDWCPLRKRTISDIIGKNYEM